MPPSPGHDALPLFLPRASVPVSSPSAWKSEWLYELATPMICGKDVASPSRAVPWSASDHQPYLGMSRRGTAPAPFTKRTDFSALESSATSAPTRSAVGFVWSHQAAEAPLLAHTTEGVMSSAAALLRSPKAKTEERMKETKEFVSSSETE
jgi:hypothetical protein